MNKLMLISVFVAAAFSAACSAPGLGGGNYTRSQVRGEQSVRLGIVESVRDVMIDARDTGTGGLVGAGLGGVAGSTLGRGEKAGIAGAIVGAVVGGIAGDAIEKSGNNKKGVEVTIRLEAGNLIAITQEKDEEFRVGDKVRILSGQGATRVSRY